MYSPYCLTQVNDTIILFARGFRRGCGFAWSAVHLWLKLLHLVLFFSPCSFLIQFTLTPRPLFCLGWHISSLLSYAFLCTWFEEKMALLSNLFNIKGGRLEGGEAWRQLDFDLKSNVGFSNLLICLPVRLSVVVFGEASLSEVLQLKKLNQRSLGSLSR